MRLCAGRGDRPVGFARRQPPRRSRGGRPGAPGAESYFDLARKDCLGTASDTGSKVWYTVAGGVLSDVYEPTIDNTNVETLQYIVTDGSTFTDLQTRDMTYTVAADPTGMACTVTSTDARHGYRLVTTYITDPGPGHRAHAHRAVAYPVRAGLAGLHLYARLDAHVNGNGGGGSAERAAPNTGVVDTRRRPGRLQHHHGHQRGQPRLRGADVHGAGQQHPGAARPASATRAPPATG